jgi:hypothetical protein
MKLVLTVSKTFFPKHPKAGQLTYFEEKITAFQGNAYKKIHTCRSNYGYWAKRISRLKETGGVLSVRQWSGKPYRSPQEIVIDIPAEQISVQKLTFDKDRDGNVSLKFFNVDGNFLELETLANNDGLSLEDFKSWFKGYDLSAPLAIIHFTKFRY